MKDRDDVILTTRRAQEFLTRFDNGYSTDFKSRIRMICDHLVWLLKENKLDPTLKENRVDDAMLYIQRMLGTYPDTMGELLDCVFGYLEVSDIDQFEIVIRRN